jgi:uncharacterized protein YukJ
MPLSNYGVLKGTVVGHLRDADDDHYQILLRAGSTLHRVAVNVKSKAPKSPATLLFSSKTSLPAPFTRALLALPAGFRKLPSRAGGLALDYQRSGIVNTAAMKPVPPDVPGADNDLKDLVEAAVIRALKAPGALLHALGARWGPEKTRPDQYFRFSPGSGIHDIHLNQGNAAPYSRDNGTWQDGALVFAYPGDKWRAFFFAFQSQRLPTDANGQPLPGSRTF